MNKQSEQIFGNEKKKLEERKLSSNLLDDFGGDDGDRLLEGRDVRRQQLHLALVVQVLQPLDGAERVHAAHDLAYAGIPLQRQSARQSRSSRTQLTGIILIR